MLKCFVLLAALSSALMLSACGSQSVSDGAKAMPMQAWDDGDNIRMPEEIVLNTYGTPAPAGSADSSAPPPPAPDPGQAASAGMTAGALAALQPTPGALAAQMALPGASPVKPAGQDMAQAEQANPAAGEAEVPMPAQVEIAPDVPRESSPLAWMDDRTPEGIPIHPAE